MILAGVLAACSPLLGIEDPKPRTDAGVIDDAPIDDAPIVVDAIDAPAADYLMLSVGDFKLARDQVMRLRVQLMRAGGGMDDVTGEATYSADNSAVTFGAKGTIQGAQPGSSTITVSRAGAISATVKATVSTVQCHPVINEFSTGTTALGGDDEFIEVYNPCINTIVVEGWTLNYRAASAVTGADTHLLVTLTGSMLSGEFRVYGGSAYAGTSVDQWAMGDGMQQANGGVGLRSAVTSTGPLVDSVGYGGVINTHAFVETMPMTAMAHNMSASRFPFDGKDDAPTGTVDGDNSADFKVLPTPTPGALNVP